MKIKVAKSVFFPQYKKVADLVRKRILNGSYSIKVFPSERRLADELGVNYMTVRRGLQILETEDILVRQPNGRMRVKHIQQGKKTHLNFCFLSPSSSSGDVETWRWAVKKATANLPCTVRPVLFMHWDDPILLDCLKGFDGIFLYPPPEEVPEMVAGYLRQPEHPVIVLDEDLSAYGAPSIQLFPPVSIQKLLDHLAALGHTRIGCFNTQPGHVVQSRINQWRYWMAAHGFTGHLADHPLSLHGDTMASAYHVMKELLEDPARTETAWLCVTAPPAAGAMRAMLDKGLMPGRDIAICSVNGESLAQMLNPRLTSLESADPAPYLAICLEWMMKGSGHWQGPLLMRPHDVPLYVRESTQPGVALNTIL